MNGRNNQEIDDILQHLINDSPELKYLHLAREKIDMLEIERIAAALENNTHVIGLIILSENINARALKVLRHAVSNNDRLTYFFDYSEESLKDPQKIAIIQEINNLIANNREKHQHLLPQETSPFQLQPPEDASVEYAKIQVAVNQELDYAKLIESLTQLDSEPDLLNKLLCMDYIAFTEILQSESQNIFTLSELKFLKIFALDLADEIDMHISHQVESTYTSVIPQSLFKRPLQDAQNSMLATLRSELDENPDANQFILDKLANLKSDEALNTLVLDMNRSELPYLKKMHTTLLTAANASPLKAEFIEMLITMINKYEFSHTFYDSGDDMLNNEENSSFQAESEGYVSGDFDSEDEEKLASLSL